MDPRVIVLALGRAGGCILKRVVATALTGFFLLCAVVVYRTASLRSSRPDVPPLPVRNVDVEAAAGRLARGLTFRTISAGEGEPVARDAFLALRAHLERSYPRVHASLGRETVSQYSLLYTWKGADPDLEPVLLMAHQDVVPVDAAAWKYPPFSGRIVDGEIWGRGAIDDKGALFAILESVETLLAEGFRPERTLLLFFGHDEEVGGAQGAARAAALLEARGVHLAWVVDEGGFVVNGLLEGLETPIALVGIAEKGSLTLQLDLEGTGGHSSVPPRHSAIGIVSEAVTRLERNPMPGGIDDLAHDLLEGVAPEQPLGVRAALANLWLTGPLVEAVMAENPALDAMQRTTTAVTMIEGGVKANVLPSHVRATVNFRIRPGDTVDDVRRHVQETVDDERITIATVGTPREASPIAPTDSEAFAQVERTIAEVFPGVPVVPYLMVAGTDSRNFYRITPNVLRFNPFRFGPESRTLPHGTNERLPVAALADAVRFYTRLIESSGRP